MRRGRVERAGLGRVLVQPWGGSCREWAAIPAASSGGCRLPTPHPGPAARACLQSQPRAGRAGQRGVLGSRRSLAEDSRAVSGLASPRAQGTLPDRCSSDLGRSASMNPFLTAFCLCLGVVLGAPRLDPELDGHWQLWKSWHKKDYHEVSPGVRALLGKR